MRRIIFVGEHFTEGDGPGHGEGVLRVCLLAQSLINADLLKYRKFPLIYESGVRYQMEPRGLEEFRDIPTILKNGCGDCDDLACWRVAELWMRFGINARPVFTCRMQPNGMRMYHILVQYPDGHIEDPSLILGMGRGDIRG
jgi:hypothetical protein